MVTATALAAAGLGVALDRVLGEPPASLPHPVALHGRAVRALEQALWADDRARGAAFTLAAVGGPVALGSLVGGTAAARAAATTLVVAGRALSQAAAEVGSALEAGDLDRAREFLPALVGRDPASLDSAGICRAVVESVAENTVDALVAPALWAALAGVPGALGYRATNTLDAMVGYRSERYERFGWASARLDDVANWVPARLTALLVAAVRPGRAGVVRATVRRDARAHPSPNAGVAESAFAGALGLQLGGSDMVDGVRRDRALLGDGAAPAVADIARANRLSADVGWALAGALAVPWLVRRSRP